MSRVGIGPPRGTAADLDVQAFDLHIRVDDGGVAGI